MHFSGILAQHPLNSLQVNMISTMHSEPEQHYQQWIDREQTSSDILTARPMEALAATLDRKVLRFNEGDALPALWHWLYFLDPAPQSQLAIDGHPQRGDFLPPIALPRRMWAGSRIHFQRLLCVGASVKRSSKIKSITLKQGRSGDLAFVCVAHEISDHEGLALCEEHDIVYRDYSKEKPVADAATAQKPERKADFSKTVNPDPVLLFRYSALTFNGHRIHYDREYASNTESYPGLVVHGPLLATLLVEFLTETYPDQKLLHFEFKALKPVFDTGTFHVCVNKINDEGTSKLWIADSEGECCIDATATLGHRYD